MEEKTKVFVRHLNASHQSESLTKFLPLNEELKKEIHKNVYEIFDFH